MQKRWFWLLNGLLILLYVWALGEETAVSLQVNDGRCIAILPERHIAIDCPQMGAGSQVGLVASQPTTNQAELASYPPLRWLAPHTAWNNLNLYSLDGQPIWQHRFSRIKWADWQTLSGGWQTRWGELRATASQNSLVLRQPVGDGFILTSQLRRAEAEAGLLLLHPDGRTGFVFIIDGADRRGVWWTWENGRIATPLIGIPFQKPLVEQAKTVLRLLLTGHQAALLLLGVVWILKKAGTQRGTEEAQSFTERKISNLQSPISQKFTAVFLTLLTFALTLHIASDVLARVPHVQDSLTYLFQAQTLARGDLWTEAPALPEFFAQEFLLVQNGRWFGKYPPGFPIIFALGVLLNAPWLINPLLATLTVPLVYQLGRRMGNGRIALIAAGLMTLSPFFLFLSGSQMAHAAELFWLTLFMLFWWMVNTLTVRFLPQEQEFLTQRGKEAKRQRIVRPLCFFAPLRQKIFWLVQMREGGKKEHNVAQREHRGAQRVGLALVAGVAAGMAFLTRQLTAVAIVAPFFLLITWFSPLPWRDRLKRGAIWLAGLLPLVALLFVYQWAVTGDPWQDPRLLYWPYDQLGFGDDVGEAPNLLTIELLDAEPGYAVLWQTDPNQPPRGHTPQRGLHNILRNWQALQIDLFGWLPVLTFSFLWLGFLLKRPSQIDWILLATLISLLVAEAFYWHSGIMYGPRYLYGALPALLLLTARGGEALAGRLGGRCGWWLTAVPLTLLILGNIFTLPGRMDSYRGYNFVVGDKVALVKEAVPPNEKALIFVSSPTGGWWEYGELFVGNEGVVNGRLVFARDLGAEINRTLLAVYPDHQAYLFSDGELHLLNSESEQ